MKKRVVQTVVVMMELSVCAVVVMMELSVCAVVVMMELSVCALVANVHNVGSFIGGDSAWQNSMPVAIPVTKQDPLKIKFCENNYI